MGFNSLYLILIATITSFSIDCPNLRIFAQGVGIQTVRPSIWISLQGDCCLATGISCISQRVTEIRWGNMLLNGTINGTALPISLTVFYVHDNKLTGPLPTNWPGNLEWLDVNSNLLAGSFPPLWPSTLKMLDLSHNKITGNVPTLSTGIFMLHIHDNLLTGDVPTLPSTITDLMLGDPGGYLGNHLSGTVALLKPTFVTINDNWIVDIIIQDTSVLTTCDLSNNPLLGNPRIATLTMCTKNALYSPSILSKTMKVSTTVIKFSSVSADVTTPLTAATTSSHKDTDAATTSMASPMIYSISIDCTTMCLQNGLSSAYSLQSSFGTQMNGDSILM